MNNVLILLTNYYPYHKGEEYLESEIEFLSKEFEKIIIVPTMLNNKMLVTRKTPENSIVIAETVNLNLLKKLDYLLQPALNKPYDERANNLLKKLYLNYFYNRSKDIYNKTIDQINKEIRNTNLDQNQSSITIYSYWMFVTSILGIELKNKIKKTNNRKLNLISRAHRYDLYEDLFPIKFLPYRNLILNEYNYIYPCSQDGVDYINRVYSPEANISKKIQVRRLGTSSTNITCLPHENSYLKLVSCSALRKVKRVDLIIDALEILESQGLQYEWVHIGDGPEFEKIKNYANEKLNEKNFRFMGRVDNKDIPSLYQSINPSYFINVSSSEGVPVSIMEALSISIPIIATNVGGTSEIVLDKYNGFLLDKGINKYDLANCLINASRINKKEMTRLSVKSKDVWETKSNALILYKDFAKEIKFE